jgi:hypothetical protein
MGGRTPPLPVCVVGARAETRAIDGVQFPGAGILGAGYPREHVDPILKDGGREWRSQSRRVPLTRWWVCASCGWWSSAKKVRAAYRLAGGSEAYFSCSG